MESVCCVDVEVLSTGLSEVFMSEYLGLHTEDIIIEHCSLRGFVSSQSTLGIP